MLMVAASHLRVVQLDESTGEIHGEGCPSCETKEGEVVELTKKLRGMARELGELKRDKRAEAENSHLWPRALHHFRYWQRIANHPRSSWTAERFLLCESFLKRFDDAMITRAIDGQCFDPFMVQRKNGSTKRFDSWELLFRDDAHFEEACNKAPKESHGK